MSLLLFQQNIRYRSIKPETPQYHSQVDMTLSKWGVCWRYLSQTNRHFLIRDLLDASVIIVQHEHSNHKVHTFPPIDITRPLHRLF